MKQEKRRKRGKVRRRLNNAPSRKELEMFLYTETFSSHKCYLSTQIRIYREPIIINPSTFHYFYPRNGGSLRCKVFWNFLSSDAKCKKGLLCPRPSSLIHKALSRENRACGEWIGMMWGQGKWWSNVGKDIYKGHPCHLFKNTFHSNGSKRIFDELGESAVTQLSDNSLSFLAHPL